MPTTTPNPRIKGGINGKNRGFCSTFAPQIASIMAKFLLLLLRIILGIALLIGLALLGIIIYGTVTDYQPPETEDISTEGASNLPLTDTLTFFSWNIGYCGLGAKSDFFYDGGKMVHSPQDWVNDNYAQVQKVLTTQPTPINFYMLQEVDKHSKRSYDLDQVSGISQLLNLNSAFATNYKVKFVPLPFTNPMGYVFSGLASYSPHRSVGNTRYQYPGKFEWPRRLFMLDRCFLVQRYDTPNGKQLLVINTHNSAYDTQGTLKKAEMDYLNRFLTDEYAKGNYIVVGGDWNQCPPNFDGNKFLKPGMQPYDPKNIAPDYLPATWQWAYDANVATNRSNLFAFDKDKTSTTLIDFFLVSPNIEILQTKGIDLQFQNSDHQPVLMSVKLR